MAESTDVHELERFVEAQERVAPGAPGRSYDRALAEIRDGEKVSHWMWYVFPQLDGLGSSPTSRLYSVKSLAEAEAYMDHLVLGPRLRECAEATLAVQGRSAWAIFGSPDDWKLRSCATLFALVSPPDSVFHRLLDKYFEGRPDQKTLDLLGIAPDRPWHQYHGGP
ncbi:MAG: DUF1810 domain-containing protein [Thermoleophilia bacterium]|nr:DUF1810 domain-containing protein [Thermoleophilia bacterium]